MSRVSVLPRLTILSIVILVVSLTNVAQTKAGHRLGSQLRWMQKNRVTAANLKEISRNGYFKVFERNKRMFVTVIAEATPAADVYLRFYGAQNLRRHGPVITADVPLSALNRLSGVKEIRYMRAARRLNPHLDLSVPTLPSGSIGLEVDRTIVVDSGYYTFPPPWSSGSGQGVVFGLVDTGIDYRHADFDNSDDTTRIKYIWDHNTSAFCTEADINDLSCSHTDGNGHGSHVSGTAAGNGRATGNGLPEYRVVGVAPEADIMAVATSFSDASILNGISEIFEKAAELGQPAVINMSLGGHFGPHDGTDPLDVGIDALTGPGQIVVVSAGNEGSDWIHNQGDWSGSNVDFTFNVATAAGQGYYLDFDIWHNGLDSYRVQISEPNNGNTPIWNVGESSAKNLKKGQAVVWNPAADETEYNGDKEIVIELRNELRTGTFTISLIGDDVSSDDPNRIDAWIWLDYRGTYLGAYTTFTNGDNNSSVGTPGTAKSVITVAAYTSKEVWESIDGFWYLWGEDDEEICTFSSLGPTRDDRLKPDISAPGSAISAAFSQDSSTDIELISPDGVHTVMQGTSMSSPHIAGLAALLLEKHATYTPQAIKSILAYRADRDGWVGSAPNNTWGYGKAHATDALAQAAVTNRPYFSTAEQHPNPSPDVNNTLVALGSGFLPQGSGPERYVYQWQKHNGNFYENISGATYKRLEPQLFSSGDLVRVVITPSQYISGGLGYTGLLLGASRMAAQTIQSSSSLVSHTGSEGWCMVSVPSEDDTAILGDFSEDLYEWDEDAQGYVAATVAERGKGYWVEVLGGEGYMHSDGLAVPAGDFTSPALTYHPISTFRPGRHLIGNPFNKPIYWENIYVSTNPGSFTLRVTDPGAASLINNVYYAEYDNLAGAYRYYDPDDFEERDGKIFPWEGFWIAVKQEVYLLITETQTAPTVSYLPDPYPIQPTVNQSGMLAKISRLITSQFGFEDPDYSSRESVDNWRLKISAFSGDLRDDYNYIGIHSASLTGRDQKDIPDAGTLSSQKHVLLYMLHDDWGRDSGRYCVDMRANRNPASDVKVSARRALPFSKPKPRPVEPQQHEWELVLKSKGLDRPVTLTWRQPPVGWRLKILDTLTGNWQAMGRNNTYSFTPEKEGEERSFVIQAVQVDL
ncbi:MAG: S8 family serine peptidase [Deltaproteobacteria bacterium]|nr:S8 family serine peptidase [Deltaproteobacteria bacterium]